MPIMLYKHPGPHKIHGDMFDYIIVERDELDQKIRDGWHTTTPNALKDSLNRIKPESIKKEETIRLSYNDFSEDQKEEIRNDKGTLQQLSKKYSTTMYTIRKIRDFS